MGAWTMNRKKIEMLWQSNLWGLSCRTFNWKVFIKGRKMIVILQKYQLLQKFMGLDPRGGRLNFLRRFTFSILVMLSICLPSTILVLNIRDNTNLALSTMPAISGFVAVAPTYFHLIIKRERIYSFLNELQEIVNNSMWNHLVSTPLSNCTHL